MAYSLENRYYCKYSNTLVCLFNSMSLTQDRLGSKTGSVKQREVNLMSKRLLTWAGEEDVVHGVQSRSPTLVINIDGHQTLAVIRRPADEEGNYHSHCIHNHTLWYALYLRHYIYTAFIRTGLHTCLYCIITYVHDVYDVCCSHFTSGIISAVKCSPFISKVHLIQCSTEQLGPDKS